MSNTEKQIQIDWELETNKPPAYESILVYGVLEHEEQADTHEGYWDGKKWNSVRYWPDINKVTDWRHLGIHNVTHWTHRPTPSSGLANDKVEACQ